MKRILAAALALAVSAPVMAKTLTFKFEVHSSGPMIYACNAGLRHVPSNIKVCYDPDYPGTTSPSCLPAWNHCTCTGTNGGDYLMDGFRGAFTPWNGTSETDGWDNANITNFAYSAGNGDFKMLFDSAKPEDRFTKKLDRVSFELGSELYGAEYFIDVCFRGSQIDYYDPNPALQIKSRNTHSAKISVTDILHASNYSYIGLAKPKVRVMTMCDRQGQPGSNEGVYVYAHNNNGVYDTFETDLKINIFDQFLNEGKLGTESTTPHPYMSDWTVQSGLVAPVNQFTTLFNNLVINTNSSAHPRFCITRYYFKESNMNVRKWQRHDALFVTETAIEEAH